MQADVANSKNSRKPIEIIEAGLRKRRAAEFRFKLYGLTAITFGLVFLAILFATIAGNAYSAFEQAQIKLDVYLDPELLDPDGARDPDVLSDADYG
nr:DUF3333 domain-containing protein [Burkholderiales bacterium]